MDNRIEIVKGDITKFKVDAIVNAANTTLLGGGGVDGAIHEAAGYKLLEECRMIGGCKTGEVKITLGYRLPAKYVIHTVGPVWHGGNSHEEIFLNKSYLNTLKLSKFYNIKTIAFPSISTGSFGYPVKEACKIAISVIDEFLKNDSDIEKIYIVCYTEEVYEAYINEVMYYKNRNGG